MTKQTGWWYRASKEQRLEQIRAGIELGMTSSQVAMNCGCYYSQAAYGEGGGLVRSFANSHGLSFPSKLSSGGLKKVQKSRARFFEKLSIREPMDSEEAFDIFGDRSSRNEFTSIFETAEA